MIGRKKEICELENAYSGRESEFVAVYGRRRIGKTYLVRETFSERMVFQHTGLKNKPTTIQLDRFRQSLEEAGLPECGVLKNWYKAFDALKTVIMASKRPKKVIFIDELQWMDRPNANFVSALENFWNGWASARKDVLLIVCGSASSWILRKIVYNKEGLHNRVTYRIPLSPFSLAECEAYAKDHRLEFTRRQLAELYMILGGVPYYWHFLERGKSVAQNIDEMFFSKSDKLEGEFDELYASLFQSPEPYVRLITALATKKVGMTRDTLSATSGIPESGKMTQCLDDLDRCGFIRKYTPLGKTNRGSVYQLMDNFTLFYFSFMASGRSVDRQYWSKLQSTRTHSTWSGLAFERLCLQHIDQIKRALQIGGVITNEHAWYSPAAQIDLLIDRDDGIINLCEMKFSEGMHAISKQEADAVRRKKFALKEETATKKAVYVTYVTTEGLKRNAYANDVQSEVMLDDLFRDM